MPNKDKEKEEKYGTEQPAPKPTPVTILDWIPGWLPGVQDARNAKKRIEGKRKERENIE